MNKQLEIANRIILLNEKKNKLESNLNYLKIEPKKEPNGKSLNIRLNNGRNGGYNWMELTDDEDAVKCVNNALLEYSNTKIIEIEAQLKEIQFK